MRLSHLLAWTTLVTHTLAAPPSDPTFSRTPFLSKQSQYGADSTWKRLRNAVIEKIWAVPSKSPEQINHARPRESVSLNFRRRYGNDIVLRFKLATVEEARAFSEAVEILYLDIWDTSDEWVDVRVARDVLPSFLGLLPPSLQHTHTPLMHDLAQMVYETFPSTNSEPWRIPSTLDRGDRDIFFQNYQPLSAINPWLRFLASMFPDRAEIFSIGTSAEGRDIPALRIGALDAGLQTTPRQTVLLAAGSHAREWISVSTNMYVAYTLLTSYQPNARPSDHRARDITKFLTHFDIIFIPVLNPDGYEYTWATDRLWRKTRQSTSLPFCNGFDLDRSFDFNWDGSVSDNACSENYSGTQPFEAVEARQLAEWARNQTRDRHIEFAAYLDFHSYSQKVMYPYSYSCRDIPPNLEDLQELALGLAKNFRVTTGQYYGVGSACQGMFSGTASNGGSALDWFYATPGLNVKTAFHIKLRDTGSYGFLLPKENIVPSGKEAVGAVVGLGRWLLGNRGIELDEVQHEPGVASDQHDPETNLGVQFTSTTSSRPLNILQHMQQDVHDAQAPISQQSSPDPPTGLASPLIGEVLDETEDELEPETTFSPEQWEREFDPELFMRRKR